MTSRPRRLAALYALLLLASWTWQWLGVPRAVPEPPPGRHRTAIPAFDGSGPVLRSGVARPSWITFSRWPASPATDPDRPVVLLLHGSPGDGTNFNRLAPLLAARGWDVLAPDLPGFGDSDPTPPSMSMLAGARATLAWLDRLGVRRVHAVGWSNAGGVVLHMADLAPDRVASVTLLAAVGAQENEGSGNYYVEHAKYALGFAVFGAPDLIPHFGLLGSFRDRTAFVRNFWDSDQRPLRSIMARLPHPALVLHGRGDVLISVRAAIDHWITLPNARLVLLDANHFLPFLQADESARVLARFFAQVEGGQVVPEPDETPAGPVAARGPGPGAAMDWIVSTRSGGPWALIEPARESLRKAPWWFEWLLIAGFTAWRRGVGLLLASALTAGMDVDFFVAWLGLLGGLAAPQVWTAADARLSRRAAEVHRAGRLVRAAADGAPASIEDWAHRLARPGPVPWRAFALGWAFEFAPDQRHASLAGVLSRHAPGVSVDRAAFLVGRAAAVPFFAAVSLLACTLALNLVAAPLGEFNGLPGLAAGVAIAVAIGWIAPLLLVRRGRWHLRRALTRLRRWEYWPAWLFYLPLVPWWIFLGLTRRPTALLACNPGIDAGGGMIGESKHAIMRRLSARPDAPPATGPSAHHHPSAARPLPTFLLPPGPLEHRLAALDRLQAEHPGVIDFPLILKPDSGWRGFGVSLVRSRAEAADALARLRAPAIAQPFDPGPEEAGILWVRRRPDRDGPATGPHEGLILGVTAKVFPTITADGRRSLEELLWTHPRFHAQAPVFLERFIHEASRVPPEGRHLALAVAGNHCQGTLFRDGAHLITPALLDALDALARRHRGLDIGRFDVRARSADDLRAGRCTVIELNGSSSEPTHVYDPDRSLLDAYRIMFDYWRRVFDLGMDRVRAGARPTALGDLWARGRRHYRERAGSAVSD